MADPTTSPTGEIHDIGYRHYDGPRLGPGYIARSLYVDTLRGTFGLGRSARSKIMPFVLAALMVLPTVAIGIVTSYFDLQALPLPYTQYAVSFQVVITIFLGAQAPAAMSRDLRFKIAPLYFSRPLSRQQYVRAKFAGMTTALFILVGVPITVLFIGAWLADLPFGDQWPDYLRAMGGAVVLALLLAGIGLAVAAMTPRRGLGVAAVVGVLLVTSGLQVTVRAMATEFGNDTFAGYAGLLSPFSLTDGIVTTVFGGESAMPVGQPQGAVMGAVFCGVAVLLVLGSYAVLVRRYGKALS